MRERKNWFTQVLRGAALVIGGLLLVQAAASAPEYRTDQERLYYGIEMNGVLCGYAEFSISPMEDDGEQMTLLEEKMFMMVSALGSEVNSEIFLTYHLNEATGEFNYHHSRIVRDPVELTSEIRIEGDTARCTASTSDDVELVMLPSDVTFENTLFFPHLKRDFVESGLDEKSYEVFEVREWEIQKATYTKEGSEDLELGGKTYDAVVLNRLSHGTGLKVRMWIDAETGRVLKTTHAGDRVSYLADESVVRRIEVANLDEDLTSKVDVAIADFRKISYMKVHATIEPAGLWVTSDALNVPGQTFTGTVKDNLIEGIFEIEHRRYDGSDAPPYPPDFSGDESLKEYLKPGGLCESDDPVLVEKARAIAEGSSDSWKAACRLSRWVSENISYAIPGGMTARNTFDTGSGECGAHSLLLAAFCRAVGIPARVVWGCMYIPNFGGSFGQHGWNEIYMGSAGWVPVDATASEIDYVDSGHIRIGVLESMTAFFNPGEMEVLDYRAGSLKMGDAEEVIPVEYEPYVGEYRSIGGDKGVLNVFVQGGRLAVDIPEKVILALEDANEEGLWFCALTKDLYFVFNEDDSGKAVEMEIHELISMPKHSEPVEMDEAAPEEMRPYLGEYIFPPLQAQFTVFHQEGRLAINDPLEKRVVRLKPPDENGQWLDEFDKNTISFEFDDDGSVTAMRIDAVSRFTR